MKKRIILLITFVILHTAANGDSYKGGKKGVVVSPCSIASKVGIDILKKGGNSIDAAVAVSFAIAVTWPEAGNIGGGGFMVIRFPNGEATSIDYRETAPNKASRDMYLDNYKKPIAGLSTIGPLAAGVPGTVAGMYLAWEKYGKLSWGELIDPAIVLAEKGFSVNLSINEGLKRHYQKLNRFSGSRKLFYPEGKIPEVGVKLVLPDLAKTLKLIKEKGKNGFYRGIVARKIVAAMEKDGGLISLKDLKSYEAVEREPIMFQYRDLGIVTMGLPSSGGICLAMVLKIIENFNLKDTGFFSAESIHKITEAERYAFANRSKYLGDPDFVKVKEEYFLSDKLNDSLASEIPDGYAGKSGDKNVMIINESEQTTHFSIIDKNGMAVSNTTTLNSSYGSGYVAEGTGILLNNEMDDFSIKPGVPNQYGLVGAEANAIEPKKRMLSSMTPTILTKNGEVSAILGTPGGSTIITTVAQLIFNMTDFEMSLKEAVHAPRFHHQWLPDKIFFEKHSLNAELKKKLMTMGYSIIERSHIGDVNGIVKDEKKKIYIGVSDWRRQGGVCSY